MATNPSRPEAQHSQTYRKSCAQPIRILVFAPHFAEYATRLAVALSDRAQVLVVTEARNKQAECTGLSIGANASSRSASVTYRCDFTNRRRSAIGAFERWPK